MKFQPILWNEDSAEYLNGIRTVYGEKFVDYPLPAVSSKISLFSLPKSHPAFGLADNLGVVATHNIKKGEIIGYYAGILEPDRSNPFNAYIMPSDPDNNVVFNAFSCGNEIRCVNDYDRVYNCPNVYIGDVVHLTNAPNWVTARPMKAICDIEAGTELVSNYGEDYWQMLNFASADPVNKPLEKYSYEVGDRIEIDMSKLSNVKQQYAFMKTAKITFTIIDILDNNKYNIMHKKLKIVVNRNALYKSRGSVGKDYKVNDKVEVFTKLYSYKGWWSATVVEKNIASYFVKLDATTHVVKMKKFYLRDQK